MILDSSAVLTVLFEEEGRDRVFDVISDASVLAIGAPTLFETRMVAAARLGVRGRSLVAQFLDRWEVVVAPFDHRHSLVATDAFLRYGKGRKHPARLNYGDCMTYATARVAEMPLLFTGDDFAKTDIPVA